MYRGEGRRSFTKRKEYEERDHHRGCIDCHIKYVIEIVIERESVNAQREEQRIDEKKRSSVVVVCVSTTSSYRSEIGYPVRHGIGRICRSEL